MKCLNCGKEAQTYLCRDCQTPEILDKVFKEVCFYNPYTCENPYVIEYANSMAEKYQERNCIPELLSLFSEDISEYYYCVYYGKCKDSCFEDKAIAYINAHPLSELHTQRILNDLLGKYSRHEFIKPRKWCDMIFETENLCAELYAKAAQYYAMVGEYDLSDQLVEKVRGYCNDHSAVFLYASQPNMLIHLEKLQSDTNRYRTKKAYWPKCKEAQEAIAKIYDEKGIVYGRSMSRLQKIRESDFAPIKECDDAGFTDYCAFWCAEAFSRVSAKDIYQIAAVRIRNGKVTDQFQSYVRPWDCATIRENTAAAENIPLDDLESADNVNQVMPKFFDFVNDDILVSTDALGSQEKLLTRAARYAGMKEIKNEFFELLDFAADTIHELEFKNSTREYLLTYFDMEEGLDSLGKAKVNALLYQKLSEYSK